MKLKLKFCRFEKALVMQVLEQKGLPAQKDKGFVKIINYPTMGSNAIHLRGEFKETNLSPSYITFNDNTARDEYLERVIKAITDEIFTVARSLKLGDCVMCKNLLGETVERKVDANGVLNINDLSAIYINNNPITPKRTEQGDVLTVEWDSERSGNEQ